ncbi:MAG: hypothetical protein ACI83P_001962 [Janthinobacterium sp.]|jgi:hypothetical protein
MDDSVKQAIAKWPSVPACHGWLALDARGHWRMRDERTQNLNLAGDKIAHVALMAFIARNYDNDASGCWFFQNGPQRVYVNLEATPYICRSDAQQGFVLHTGQPMPHVDAAFLSDAGALILRAGSIVAQLDDRDVAQVLGQIERAGQAVSDDALLNWLSDGAGELGLRIDGRLIAIEAIASNAIDRHFGFVRTPAPH